MEESDDHSQSVHIGGLSGALGSLRPLFEQVIREILRSQGVEKYALSITFTDDDEITRINRESLGRDRPTDVIAFDLSEEGLPLDRVGDVYISLDTALANSRRFGVSRNEELLRLVAHGTLHVLGYTDGSSSERREMEELQERIVEKFSSGLRQ
ncbi:MAG: rRNA maturation RNase YbeY [bacterium]|jgi:rRNA maturation RNase YbeY